MPVNQYRTTINVIETHQQLDHGGLTGTSWTHNGNLLTWFNQCREVIDDDFFGAVAKVNITEFNLTVHNRQLDGIRGFIDFFTLSQEFKHALSCRSGLL